MKRYSAHLLGLVLACSGLACNPSTAAPPSVRIEYVDVERFYAPYDATEGWPAADALQTYIDTGSEGLQTLARRRSVTGVRIAEALADRPEIYAAARSCAASLPAVRSRLTQVLDRLIELYPKARTPAVTLAIGRGRPVAIGYPDSGVQVGLEALCSAHFLHADIESRFVHVIAHEYVHVQQSSALVERMEGGSPTVLDVALAEGAAEFIGELISGDIAYGSLRGDVAGRELDIERRFQAEMHQTDLSAWVYNSTPQTPGDLGYWVGYRIAKAHYAHATDKRAAVAELLEFTDAKALLEASGWYPGITLETH